MYKQALGSENKTKNRAILSTNISPKNSIHTWTFRRYFLQNNRKNPPDEGKKPKPNFVCRTKALFFINKG